MYASASGSGAGPSASRAFQRPGTTLIGDKLFEEHSLLPIDVTDFTEIRDSRRRRAILEEALCPVLPQSRVELVADYSCASRLREFAEELYGELWEGRTNLLYAELFDVERRVLREPHEFWEYLAGDAQRVVVFAHMLSMVRFHHAEMKERLENFALLVASRVPLTRYFVAGYLAFSRQDSLDGSMPFALANASFDEWPQVLAEDPVKLLAGEMSVFSFAAALRYFLAQSDLERAARYFCRLKRLAKDMWFYILHILYTAEPALVRIFFDAAILLNRRRRTFVFESAAPAAMRVDPMLSKYLVAMAKKFYLAVPVAKARGDCGRLADDAKAGGNVHMRLLTFIDETMSDSGFLPARHARQLFTILHGDSILLLTMCFVLLGFG